MDVTARPTADLVTIVRMLLVEGTSCIENERVASGDEAETLAREFAQADAALQEIARRAAG